MSGCVSRNCPFFFYLVKSEAPFEAGFYDTPGYAYDVYVSRDYAYVADEYSGLRIIDVSNPASPAEISFYETPGDTNGVYVDGSYAYVEDYYEGFHIIEVSNPAAPLGVEFYNTRGNAVALETQVIAAAAREFGYSRLVFIISFS